MVDHRGHTLVVCLIIGLDHAFAETKDCGDIAARHDDPFQHDEGTLGMKKAGAAWRHADVQRSLSPASGSGAKVGALFSLPSYPGDTGIGVNLVTVGVFTLPGAGAALAARGLVYWDDAAKVVSGLGTGNLRIGVATVAAADSPIATVRLNGSF